MQEGQKYPEHQVYFLEKSSNTLKIIISTILIVLGTNT